MNNTKKKDSRAISYFRYFFLQSLGFEPTYLAYLILIFGN